jgi:hypothetical protein
VAETGYRFATSTTASTGTWTSTGNFFATDGAEGNCNIASKNVSSIQVLNNFGFTTSVLPDTATIDQVLLQSVWRVTSAGGIAVLAVAALVSGARLSTYKNSLEPTSLTTQVFDITADRAWQPADFRDGTLTVEMRPNNGNSATNPGYRFDSVSLNALYTIPAPPATRVLRTSCNLDGVGSDGLLLGNALE